MDKKNICGCLACLFLLLFNSNIGKTNNNKNNNNNKRSSAMYPVEIKESNRSIDLLEFLNCYLARAFKCCVERNENFFKFFCLQIHFFHNFFKGHRFCCLLLILCY